MFAQEGPLPGKITVVYKLGEQFEQSEALYLYDLLGNTEAQEVILQKPYGMFVLENGGEFILSDQKIEEAKQAEVMEISAFGTCEMRSELHRNSAFEIFIVRVFFRRAPDASPPGGAAVSAQR